MDTQDQDNKLAERLALREEYRHKTFVMMFEVLIIFGIPAALGYFLGQYLDTAYEVGRKGMLIVLACTFVFSWVIIIFRYRAMDRKLRQVNKDIEQIRNGNI